MQKLIIRGVLVTSALLLVATVMPASARAIEDETNDDSTSTSQTGSSEKRQEIQDRVAQNRVARLTAAKLKVCENRKKNIGKIMSRAGVRSEKQLAVFDKIATRVDEFYVKKGNTLANYNELVAAVTAAKTNAVNSIEVLKGMTFDCNSDDPKGAAEAFKAQLSTVRQNLKDYRTAVKNLIVGVKSVNGDKKEEQ